MAPSATQQTSMPLQEKDSNVNTAPAPSGKDASKEASKGKKSSGSKQSKAKVTAADLSGIHLDGEENETVARFLKLKGPQGGAGSTVFYAAYVYFEKLRIQEGKKKSAKREQMEEAWAKQGGFPREGDHNQYITCGPGERPWTDNLGKLQIDRV